VYKSALVGVQNPVN